MSVPLLPSAHPLIHKDHLWGPVGFFQRPTPVPLTPLPLQRCAEVVLSPLYRCGDLRSQREEAICLPLYCKEAEMEWTASSAW